MEIGNIGLIILIVSCFFISSLFYETNLFLTIILAVVIGFAVKFAIEKFYNKKKTN
jgi:hypothetical protein